MQFTAKQIAEFIGGRVEGNEQATVSTFAKIEEATEGLKDGSIQVFDCSAFTVTVDKEKKINANAEVDGEGHVTKYMADVDTDANYEGDTNVIEDGAFMESKFRSAPYFDLQIDGIELLDTAF